MRNPQRAVGPMKAGCVRQRYREKTKGVGGSYSARVEKKGRK